MNTKNNPARTQNSAPYQSEHIKREEEIDLLEIIEEIWNGKKTIIISVVVALIISVIYLSFTKEKWTSEAIITQPSAGQVATYNNALAILYEQNIQDKISLPDLQRQIFGRYAVSAYALSGILRNLDNPLHFKVNQVNKGQNDPLSITFTASSAKEAQEKLLFYITRLNTEVSDDLAIDMRNNIFIKMKGLKTALTVQENIAKMKKDHRIEVIQQARKIAEAAKITNTHLTQAEYLSDDTLYLLGTSALTSMIENEKTRPLELSKSYYETQRTLWALSRLRVDFTKSLNFEFIKKPDLPARRDSPRKILVILLAVIAGGAVGTFIIVARHAAQNYRRKKLL